MLFEEIYELYFRDVYRFLRSLTKDETLAEELVQETFFKALKAIDRFDGSQDIRAWLFTIARNAYYSHCRAARVTVPVEDIAEEPPDSVRLEDKLIREEDAFRIHQYLHSMKEPYKEVFSLRVFGELPFEKIGRLFGKNGSWARVTFYRAKKQIAEHMEVIERERD
ncbi:MAG: RNA polymerase sigma factor [bacterium]|nr:RNA polymerase sigma factor [bacterium]